MKARNEFEKTILSSNYIFGGYPAFDIIKDELSAAGFKSWSEPQKYMLLLGEKPIGILYGHLWPDGDTPERIYTEGGYRFVELRTAGRAVYEIKR